MSRVELETQGPQPYVLPLHYIQHFEMVPVLQVSTLLPLQRSGLLHRCQRTELTIQPRSITRVSRHQEIERFYGISAKPSSDRKQELYECSLGRFKMVPVLQLSTLLPLQRSGLLLCCQRTELTIQPRSITRVSRHQENFSCLNVFQPFTSDCMRSLCSVQRFV